MSGRLLIATAMAVLSLAACNKIKHLVNINADLPYTKAFQAPKFDTSIHIPAGGINFSLPKEAIETNSEEALALYNTTPENIISVKMSRFAQKVTDPQNANFDFFDSLRVYLSVPGLPEKMVAHTYHIPKGCAKLDLEYTDENLKDYFLRDTVYMRIQGHFVALPDEATQYKIDLNFNLLANPIGQ